MNKEEILGKLALMNQGEQIQWMLRLGANLTIAARESYPFEERPGYIKQLSGYNELQHKVYGRIHQFIRREEWTDESFISGLMETSLHYGIAGDVAWALNSSLKSADTESNT